MHGQVSVDTVVAATACSVWDVYRSLQLVTIINTYLPDVIGTVKVLEGDGRAGTIINITFPAGTPGAGYMKELFKKVDDKKRVKETQTIEGGYLALGFSLYIGHFKIIEKNSTSSIIRSAIEYKVDDANLVSLVNTNTVEALANAVGKYLSQKKTPP